MVSLCVDEEEFDVMAMSKSFFVHQAIKCICFKEDDQAIDIFSLGYGTKETLQQQTKVLSLACTNKQMTQLEAFCLSKFLMPKKKLMCLLQRMIMSKILEKKKLWSHWMQV